MKYLGKLFLSLKEIFVVMIVQYAFLFLCFIILGADNTVIWGSVLLMLVQIIYIIWKGKNIKFSLKGQNYFPYILLGIGVAALYNTIIFSIVPLKEVTVDFPIIFNILCSGIIGPIFEEFLFRYDLIRRLSKFNSNKWIIIILASIIFGLCHTGVTTIIYAMIVGLINCYIYMKDKDITKPIMVHVTGNIFVNFLTGYNITILILGIVLIIISYFIIRHDD